MANELLKRSQVAVEDTWAVEDLYETEELFLEEAGRIETMVEGLKSFTEEYITASGSHLLEYYKKQEEILIRLDRSISYSCRNMDVDTADDHYQSLNGKMMGIYHQYETVVAPIDSWIL